MREEFPLLNDPTCPEYIRAQANAEATWVAMQKGLHGTSWSAAAELTLGKE